MPYIETDLAYIAGLIDGEGYIGLVRHVELRRKKQSVYYLPKVCVSMTDRCSIDFIAERFTGNIWSVAENPRTNHKLLWNYDVRGKKRIKKLLESILPYLKIKEKQAILLLEYINLRENAPKPAPGRTTYSKKEHEIYIDFRKLNKRGIREVQYSL